MEYKRLYIAYGSNINLQQMQQRCPTAKRIGTAMLENLELEFRGVATIIPKSGAQVPVLLWEIGQQDEIALDRYEGFPRLYRKELFEIEVNGQMREAMAYVMNGHEIASPSASYYHTIRDGYLANGMDLSYLEEAADRALNIEAAEAYDLDTFQEFEW